MTSGQTIGKAKLRATVAVARCSMIVAALAVVTLLGDVWRTAHAILVHHVPCPYDGAMVHGREGNSSSRETAGAGETARAQSGGHTRRTLSLVPLHSHDECHAFAAGHLPAALPCPQSPSAGRPGEALAAGLSASKDTPARSVLAYAPKLSPPVVR